MIIPGKAKAVEMTPRTGVVVFAGEGLLLQDGRVRELPVKVGDRVAYDPMAGFTWLVGGEDLICVVVNDLLAVVLDPPVPVMPIEEV